MKIVSFVTLIILLNGLYGWLNNQPQDVGTSVPQGKLNSLSFAPFREGQGPMDKIFPTIEQIDADLLLLSDKTHNIRTYASAEGTLSTIPELARKYGLTMTQGAWLGVVKKTNRLEIDELIHSANTHPDVVTRVIVGNEVLLRKDLEKEELIEYIREVKKSVKQPVSYADVWSIYMKYPEIIKEVDFITIHILPYWEDEPIPVDKAAEHVENIYKQVRQLADSVEPNKPILIGESGWPSDGRQRGLAIPSVVNEARFIRSLIKVANDNGFDYNIVEAFNQSWKHELEGVVGATWGLFSADREEVFPLTGKVYENPNWYKNLLVSVTLFIIATVICWKQLQSLTLLQTGSMLIFMQLLTILWSHQVDCLWSTSYTLLQRLVTLLIIIASTLFAGLTVQRCYDMLRQQATHPQLSMGLYKLFMLFAGYAIFKSTWLSVDGRYVSFPTVDESIPVLGLIALMLISYFSVPLGSIKNIAITKLVNVSEYQFSTHKKMLYALMITSFTMIIGEVIVFFLSQDLILAYPEIPRRLFVSFEFTLTNYQLLGWVGCLLVLITPLYVSVKQMPHSEPQQG